MKYSESKLNIPSWEQEFFWEITLDSSLWPGRTELLQAGEWELSVCVCVCVCVWVWVWVCVCIHVYVAVICHTSTISLSGKSFLYPHKISLDHNPNEHNFYWDKYKTVSISLQMGLASLHRVARDTHHYLGHPWPHEFSLWPITVPQIALQATHFFAHWSLIKRQAIKM